MAITLGPTNESLRRTALTLQGKRIWRIQHDFTGVPDMMYRRYYKYEYTARNAFIGKGPIRQHGFKWTLQVYAGYGLWVNVSVKDISGTTHYEIGAIVA